MTWAGEPGGGDGLVLEGLRVVELAGDPAGEMVGKLLAELGADVVKVEPPEGSPTRAHRPVRRRSRRRRPQPDVLVLQHQQAQRRRRLPHPRRAGDAARGCSPTPTC